MNGLSRGQDQVLGDSDRWWIIFHNLSIIDVISVSVYFRLFRQGPAVVRLFYQQDAF